MLDISHLPVADIRLRPATASDRTELDRLRQASLAGLLLPQLSAAQTRTVVEHTPFDPALIDDQTYFVLEIGGRIVASGGWSMRSALMRQTKRQSERDGYLDPARDAARIRAMYTDPEFARCGLGSVLLSVCESALRRAGFKRAELVATPTGRPFYLARGWAEREPIVVGGKGDAGIETCLMDKRFR